MSLNKYIFCKCVCKSMGYCKRKIFVISTPGGTKLAERRWIHMLCRHLFKGWHKGGTVAPNQLAPPCFLPSSVSVVFLNFLTVAQFILLFSTVTFHNCIYFPVESLLGLQRLFALSLLQHSFVMPFHPHMSFLHQGRATVSNVHTAPPSGCRLVKRKQKKWLREWHGNETLMLLLNKTIVS